MRIGLNTSIVGGSLINPFSPSALFANGEVGVWYDPSPETTFTDTAGTTPATVGDAVARINDLSGNGNHATQATTAARPILSRVPARGRANLLTRTEEFDDAAWTKASNVTVQQVDGATWRVSGLELVAGERLFQNVTITPSQTYTASLQIKGEGANIGKTVALTLNRVGGTGNFIVQQVTLTGEFQTVTASLTMLADNTGVTYRVDRGAGDFASSALIRQPQLEESSTASAYQKVTSTYDVTEAGQADNYFLWFDGVDDFMVTPTITPGTDKVQVFAGVRRMSAARGVLVGNFAADGYFEIQLNILSAENIEFASEGTLRRTGNFSLPAAPGSNIFTQLSDISGDSLVGRADGVQVVFSSGDQGTGNYLANPIYIGARDGVDLRFNGHIYSLITRFGPNLDAPVIGKTETYVAKKTGVQL